MPFSLYLFRSIEAAASHEAKRVEQAAQGELDRQKLNNEIQAEIERAKVRHNATISQSCIGFPILKNKEYIGKVL